MPIPTVVRSTDPGAPVLNGEAGSAYNVMKHSLDLCGWTLEYDDPENFTCAFRNNPMTGSGCYVQIIDDNVSMPSSRDNDGRAFSLIVYEDMSDAHAGLGPCASGTNAVYMKRHSADSNESPWVFVGDDRTCYFTCFSQPTNPSNQYGAIGFGDYESWQPNMPGCMQSPGTQGYSSGGYYGYRSYLTTSTDHNVRVSRNPASLDYQSLPVSYFQCIPGLSSTVNNPIGSTGQPSKPAHVDRIYHVPALMFSSVGGLLGRMRGLWLPINTSTHIEMGEVQFHSDSNGSFETIQIWGTGSQTTTSYNGCAAVSLGDFDVYP